MAVRVGLWQKNIQVNFVLIPCEAGMKYREFECCITRNNPSLLYSFWTGR